MQSPPLLLKSEDRLLIILSHLSIWIGVGLLLPLIVFLLKKDEAPLVGDHAREALNFHLSLFIYSCCCIPLLFIVVGFFAMIGIVITGLVLAIIAAVRSADGAPYRYPLTIRLVR
jgi:uncharacterized Tic20 family protein